MVIPTPPSSQNQQAIRSTTAQQPAARAEAQARGAAIPEAQEVQDTEMTEQRDKRANETPANAALRQSPEGSKNSPALRGTAAKSPRPALFSKDAPGMIGSSEEDDDDESLGLRLERITKNRKAKATLPPARQPSTPSTRPPPNFVQAQVAASEVSAQHKPLTRN